GTTVLTDFDIFATAGAANTAVTQEFNTAADADGQIVIRFTVGSADLPMVNGIEILQPGTVLATTTTDVRGQYVFPVYAPGPYTVQEVPPEGWRQVAPFHSDLTTSFVTAVNAGGEADGRYLADTDFSGGSTFQTQAAIDTSHVFNPAPQAVYQTGRFGRNPDGARGVTSTFGAPQPGEVRQGATYTVRLHFAEPFFGAPKQRLFDVAINGTTVLKDFDIFAAAGAIDTAVVKEFNIVPNADGQIVIDFLPGSADLPMVNG